MLFFILVFSHTSSVYFKYNITLRSCAFVGVLRTAISGGVGGMALWAAVFPADVVKSRMQVTGSGRFSHMFVSILKNEGSFAIANLINLFIRFVPCSTFLKFTLWMDPSNPEILREAADKC